jgi:hypothetical protein
VTLRSKDHVFRREWLWLFLIMVPVDVFVLTHFANPPSWAADFDHLMFRTARETWQVGGVLCLSSAVFLVWVWVTGIQMRRKIRRLLGRKATYADLTSIDTWIKVDEIKERDERNKPLNPD